MNATTSKEQTTMAHTSELEPQKHAALLEARACARDAVECLDGLVEAFTTMGLDSWREDAREAQAKARSIATNLAICFPD